MKDFGFNIWEMSRNTALMTSIGSAGKEKQKLISRSNDESQKITQDNK